MVFEVVSALAAGGSGDRIRSTSFGFATIWVGAVPFTALLARGSGCCLEVLLGWVRLTKVISGRGLPETSGRGLSDRSPVVGGSLLCKLEVNGG